MTQEPEAQPTKSSTERRLLLLLGAVYLAFAISYTFIIPLGYGPDEPRHYNVVKRLVEKRQLPRLVNGAEEDYAIVLHPPLYYVLLTPFYAAVKGFGDLAAQRVLRFLSPLLVGGALWLFYLSLLRLFPTRPALRLGALAIAALLPHVLLESAVINNDTLTILLGSLLAWQIVRLEGRLPSTRESVLAGLTLAALANSKGTGLTLTPVWLIYLLAVYRVRGLRERGFWQAFAVGYLPVLLLGTWWYARNIALYGNLVPLPVPDFCQPRDAQTGHVYGPLELIYCGMLFVGPLWWLVGRTIGGIFLSVWTQVGWFPDAISAVLYGILGVLLAAGVAGNVAGWVASRRGQEPAEPLWPASVKVIFAAFALIYANIMLMAVFVHVGFYQGGRYLLPAIWGFALFLAIGLDRLARAARAKAALFAGVALFLVLVNAACIYNLVTYLNPLYAPK